MPPKIRTPVIIDGKPRRSVTEVVALLGLHTDRLIEAATSCAFRGTVFSRLRDEAAALGTAVHARIERDLRGIPQPEFDPFDQSTWHRACELHEAWRLHDFAYPMIESDADEVLIEHNIIGSRTHGTVDAMTRKVTSLSFGADGARIRRQSRIKDIKTSSTGRPTLENWIQQAGYTRLEEESGNEVVDTTLIVINKGNDRVKSFTKSREEIEPFCVSFDRLVDLSWALDDMGLTIDITKGSEGNDY